MKVAIVCSWLNQYGGAERVLEHLHELYPDAPIYTSVYRPRTMPAAYRSWDIRASFLQRLPFLRDRRALLLPLYPLAFEQLDLSGYDVVINNSSAFSYGVLTRPETCHICYCLSPARFLWSFPDYARRESYGPGRRVALAPLLTLLRAWDYVAAQRVDHFVGISRVVVDRIAKYYRRHAPVIHPGVETRRFTRSREIGDYFLVASRLIPYKRIDLAIQACNRLGVKLKVVGGGRDRAALERLAGPTIEFLGRVDDAALAALYARCRAFIFPGEEDFGLTPIEAQASGRPVIAYRAGGALETVVERETGEFFQRPDADALVEVLARFAPRAYDPLAIQRHAEQFDVRHFQTRIAAFVAEKLAAHRGTPSP
ncbi:MAG: glycosyltransferase [Chloroflexi bacterium]|nr:glycosyltransferase [Chloroflexota bacterium]